MRVRVLFHWPLIPKRAMIISASPQEPPGEERVPSAIPTSQLSSSPVDALVTTSTNDIAPVHTSNSRSTKEDGLVASSTVEELDGRDRNNKNASNGIYGRSGYGGYGPNMMMDPYGMGGLYGGGMLGPGMMMGGMYGMSPEAQRAQLMMFMMGKVMEIGGMLSQAFASTCGSAVELLRSYHGIAQSVDQMETEYREEFHGYLVREKERNNSLKELPPEVLKEVSRPLGQSRKMKPVSQERSVSSFFIRALRFRVLRYGVFLLFFFLCRRVKTSVMSK